VICTPLRTAVAREGGGLAALQPEEFGAQVLKAVVSASGVDPARIEDVVVGNQFHAARMGRHCALLGGLPVEVPGVSINRLCGSGLQAILYADQAIRAGTNEVLIAGGVESYTHAPYLLDRPTEAYQRQPPTFVSTASRGDFGRPDLGLTTSMAKTAENVAERYGLTREEQDRFAVESHARAARAVEGGLFKDQVVPIRLPERKGQPASFDREECLRPDTTLEGLARLRPLVRVDGTVTAGNTCKRSDAAAMMLVVAEDRAAELGLRPVARILASAQVGVHPDYMGIGPVPAIHKALARAGLTLDQVDRIELNEAFAAQVIPVMRETGMRLERVNVNGGAIALGHPTGATGAVLTVKLLHELIRCHGRYGVVTMCIGGGMGLAAVFERLTWND